METRFLRTGIGIFIASILIRPENIIYAFIFLAFLAAIRRLALTSCAIGLCVAFGIYFAETRLSQNYGWATLFYFTFIDWRILEGSACKFLGLVRLRLHLRQGSYSGLFFRQAQRFRFLRWLASEQFC